jgi:AcrR family transcriptional regulator
MAEDTASSPDLLMAAFDLIAEQGWSRLSLVAAARRAGVEPGAAYRELRSKRALLGALSRRLDEAMLGIEAAELAGLPPRDRVFELLMRRLEALVPFRPGLERLARDAGRDPCLLLAAACRLDRSLAWLQDAAGLRHSGLRARIARRALTAAYLSTLRVWRKDTAPDLGKTMVELDKGLRRVQIFAGLREPRSRPGAQTATPETA